jgi:hypothetical protein
MAMTETADTGTNRKLNRVYRTREGKEVKQIDEHVVACIIKSLDGSRSLEMDILGLFPAGDPGPCMGIAAAAMGLSTSVGNATAVSKQMGWDVPQMFQAMQERWDTIGEGEWRSDREGGPRTKYLVDAWLAMLSAQGYKLAEDLGDKLREKIVSGAVTGKSLLEKPAFRAFYDAEEVKRAQVKAAASAAAAGATSMPDGLVPEGLLK